MNILIVNDDGIESEGLKILARALTPYGKLYVAAPFNQQSGKSHAISLTKTLVIEEAELIPGTMRSIKVAGTPADAVRAGLSLFNVEFDLVVSGINEGANIAKDILYSGTVGAAMEAKVYGINAIAVSADNFDIDYLYDETIKTLDEVIENKLYDFDGVLNINFPRFEFDKTKGVIFTKQGKRFYHSEFVKKVSSENDHHIKGSITNFNEDEDSDVWAYNNGYISITPLTLDRTNYKMMRKLNNNL